MNIEEKEFHSHFSRSISKEIRDYANNEVLSERYIYIYNITSKKSHHNIIGYCTSCEKKIRGDRIDYKNRKKGYCPNCDGVFTVIFEKYKRNDDYDEGVFTYFENSIINPQVVIARSFYCFKDLREKFENTHIRFNLVGKYVFQIGKPKMYERRYSYYHKGYYYEKKKSIFNLAYQAPYESGRIIKKLSYESLEAAITNSELQYCNLKEMHRIDSIKYLALYCRFPNIEKLIKVGLKELVRGRCYGQRNYKSISWNKKNIFDMLKIDRGDWKQINENIKDLDFFNLKVYQLLKENKHAHPFSEVVEVCKKIGYINDLRKFYRLFRYVDVIKLISYLKYAKEHFRYSELLGDYSDYIEACIELDMNLKNKSILYPKNFKKAHDHVINLIEIKESEEKNLLIKARAEELSKYKFRNKNYEIVIPTTCAHIINEGKALSHCIGRYIDRHINKETTVLFIRKRFSLGTPFFTMEVRNGEIVQARGKHNKSYEKDKKVEEFIKQFKKVKLKKNKKIERHIA